MSQSESGIKSEAKKSVNCIKKIGPNWSFGGNFVAKFSNLRVRFSSSSGLTFARFDRPRNREYPEITKGLCHIRSVEIGDEY